MTVVTASRRGQIVIPQDIRKQLQIVPGKKLLIKAEGDHHGGGQTYKIHFRLSKKKSSDDLHLQ